MKFGSSIETCLTVPQFKVEPFWTILRVLFWFFPMTTIFQIFFVFTCFWRFCFLTFQIVLLKTAPSQRSILWCHTEVRDLYPSKNLVFLWFLAYFSGEDRNFCNKIWGKILQIWINIEHLVNNYNTRTAQNFVEICWLEPLILKVLFASKQPPKCYKTFQNMLRKGTFSNSETVT